jgi:hypothetical protein
MANLESLSHLLKIKFGTAPHEPTEAQIVLICDAIEKIVQSGKIPSEKDWSDAVLQYCPSAGQHSYFGIDNSDLNTLLALALQVANRKRG